MIAPLGDVDALGCGNVGDDPLEAVPAGRHGRLLLDHRFTEGTKLEPDTAQPKGEHAIERGRQMKSTESSDEVFDIGAAVERVKRDPETSGSAAADDPVL
jgi:hypothetical protein